MKAFSERNPVAIAIIGTLVIVLIGLAAFYSADLPIIGAGPTYSADFPESAGLQNGDDVLVAGVKVGDVSGVALQGNHVHVDFRVKDAWIGDQSSASIKIRTLLGQKYLQITPVGGNRLAHGATIPQSRTTSPYDVTEAFDGLAQNLTAVDTKQLATAFDSLSGAFANTPPVVRQTLTGLSALSTTIASRDAQIAQLVANTRTVTQTLADNDQQVQALFTDGNLLLQVLNQRSAAITALLQGTQTLSTQLVGLVRDNQATLQPALVKLGVVTTVLQKNQADLERGLALIGPYYNLLSGSLSNGRWLDTYACGLFQASGPDKGSPELNNDKTLGGIKQRTCNPYGDAQGVPTSP